MTFLSKCAAARELIAEARRASASLAVGCSFGKDSMVLVHLARRVDRDLPILAVLSDTELPDTVGFVRRVTIGWRYVETRFLQAHVTDLAQCCGPLKVEAMRRALAPFEAWLSGVRRSEGPTRTGFGAVERRGLTKVNPLLDFTELDVWRYTALHGLPVHPAYARGYRSLGCVRCSVPERDDAEPERSGRWQGTTNEGGECGIHVENMRTTSARAGNP